jgi:hypothetical protein
VPPDKNVPAQAGQPTTSGPGGVFQAPAAPKAPFVTLYDQYNNPGAAATGSQDFEAGLEAYDDQTADDFAIPAAQNWQVTEVDVQGVYFNGAGPAASFNVVFYTNSGTLPSTPVYTATGLAYTNTSGNFVIPLTSPANLTGGATYWVSVQARQDFATNGQFGWQDRTVQSTSGAAFRNAGGGFACSSSNWVLKTTCVTTTDPDQVFRLVGTIGGGATATATPVGPTATPCALVPVLTEGFESGTLGAFASTVPTCVPGGCGWNSVTTAAHSGTRSAFAPDLPGITDQYLTTINPIAVPPGATLSFWHRWNLENTFDGAVLEFSTNGGTTWTDAGAAILTNGYNGTISSSFGSPISGRQAWTGNPNGTNFVQTTVNLAAFAGQNLLIRFRTADDSSVAPTGGGWWIDDIAVGASSCGTPTVGPTSTNTPVGPTATATCVGGGGPGGTPGPWRTSTPGPAESYRGGATTDGTYIYVYGGGDSLGNFVNDLWRWNPATETWTQLADMPTGKQNIQGAYWNGKIYVPGGYIGSHITENAIYDIATNTWTTGAPLPAAQSGQTAAYNGKIYNIGGNPGPQSTVTVYDIATNTWSTAASLPTANTYGRAITVGNYIYYVGGIAASTANTVYRYDPVANTWATMAPLQTARTSTELASNGTYIFAVAGGDATFFAGVPLPQSVEIYDIAANTWTYGNPIVQKVAAPAGGLVGGKLMIANGVDNTLYPVIAQVSNVSGGGGGCATPTVPPVVTNTPTVPPVVTDTPTVPPVATDTPTVPPVATDTPTTEATVEASATATATATVCTVSFNDVPPNSTFYTWIRCLACRGIVGGYPCGGPGEPCPGNYYRPNNNVTRGQVSKIISESAQFSDPVPSTQQTFEDVPVGSTFSLWIERLATRGIIQGYPCGGPFEPCVGPDNRPYFRPNNNVTRGQ